jgi:predicted small secreted protein
MKKASFIVLVFSVLLSSCNGLTRGSGSEIPRASIRVENQGFSDMTVYALRSAQRVRLGLAPGHANTVFTVPSALMNGLTQLRFIADPIGGARASVSEEITVAPGDSVTLTIPPL